jgi:NAD(P)-dependent dehydrogenase (short-subunit alcohol dehydrogenase family)
MYVGMSLGEEFLNLLLRLIPLGRIGLPEEIAAAVVYLASNEWGCCKMHCNTPLMNNEC